MIWSELVFFFLRMLWSPTYRCIEYSYIEHPSQKKRKYNRTNRQTKLRGYLGPRSADQRATFSLLTGYGGLKFLHVCLWCVVFGLCLPPPPCRYSMDLLFFFLPFLCDLPLWSCHILRSHLGGEGRGGWASADFFDWWGGRSNADEWWHRLFTSIRDAFVLFTITSRQFFKQQW